MQNKVFLTIVGLYFFLSAILHFSRMALDLNIDIGGYEVPSIVSGIYFIFAVFIVYWIIREMKEKSKEVKEETELKREVEQ